MSAALAWRLVQASQRRGRRAPHLRWPARLVPQERWCFTPEWLSLCGTTTYARLDLATRRQLAFHEAVNFFSLNLHGEGPLIAGLARRTLREAGVWAPYERIMLEEERRHTGWFHGFCRRYAARVYPDRKLELPRPEAPGEEELLFFAQALVFEELVDAYDARMARDARLLPIVRRIHALHHRDEARHRTFGRSVVSALWTRHSARWPEDVRARVRLRLQGYLQAVWFEYYNPDVYRDAGLPDPVALRREAWECPAQRAHRERLSAPTRAFLARCGLLPQTVAA